MSNLSNFRTRMQDLQKKLQDEGKEALKQEFKTIFNEFPVLNAISFQVWTCNFNDGEPCYCAIYNINYNFIDNKDEWYDRNDYIRENSLSEENEKVLNSNRLTELEQDLENMVDLLKSIFGDPVEVTVTRKGIKVESCDPDF